MIVLCHLFFLQMIYYLIFRHREFKVLVGTDKINKGGKLYDIEKKIIHPKYNNLTSDYDICILKLNESLIFGPKVNKIALNDRKVKLRSRVMLNATGWGYTQVSKSIINLKKISRYNDSHRIISTNMTLRVYADRIFICLRI